MASADGKAEDNTGFEAAVLDFKRCYILINACEDQKVAITGFSICAGNHVCTYANQIKQLSTLHDKFPGNATIMIMPNKRKCIILNRMIKEHKIAWHNLVQQANTISETDIIAYFAYLPCVDNNNNGGGRSNGNDSSNSFYRINRKKCCKFGFNNRNNCRNNRNNSNNDKKYEYENKNDNGKYEYKNKNGNDYKNDNNKYANNNNGGGRSTCNSHSSGNGSGNGHNNGQSNREAPQANTPCPIHVHGTHTWGKCSLNPQNKQQHQDSNQNSNNNNRNNDQYWENCNNGQYWGNSQNNNNNNCHRNNGQYYNNSIGCIITIISTNI